MRLISKFSKTGSLISSFANVWLFDGSPDESISARCYRESEFNQSHKWDKARRFINWLFSPLQKNHCYQAYLNDYEHARKIILNEPA